MIIRKPGLLTKSTAGDQVDAVARMLDEGVISSQSKRELKKVSLRSSHGSAALGRALLDEQRDVRALDYLYEVGLLKRYKRTGWVVAGVSSPESIADHSHRTAIVAAVLAELEGADPERAAFLALFHDTQETRLTDVPYIGKRYLKAASNAEVTEDQTAGMAEGLARLLGGAEAEYEAKETAEARCAKDADKLECLLQAVEYREQGTDTQAWIDTSLAALQTDSAQRLAKLAVERAPLAWMHEARDSKPAR